MSTKIIKKNLGLTIPDILFGIFIFSLCYGSYLYLPLLYKSTQLQEIAKDYTFRSGGALPETLRQAVIEDALHKLDIVLNEDDVIVVKNNDRTKITATWRPFIELPFDYQIPVTFTAEYDKKQLF